MPSLNKWVKSEVVLHCLEVKDEAYIYVNSLRSYLDWNSEPQRGELCDEMLNL